MIMAKLAYEKFSAVVPAYNEAKRFSKVVSELLLIDELAELIFVDDGSGDNTEEVAKKFIQSDPRFKYIKHNKNRGKGAALKTGVSKSGSEVILFLDADLENITAKKIKKIVCPVLSDDVDVSRGAFRRKRGRVTEYAVKPMMEILFPDMYFEQPISGQICAKKSFLESVDFESRYGVDIGLLFDAIESGQRIIEVDIGRLIHKANKEDAIGEMSRQVLETMIKKAGLIQHKYKLIIFTLDNTLIDKKSLDSIFKKIGIYKQVSKFQEDLSSEKISYDKFLEKCARLYEGIDREKITRACDDAKFAKYSKEVIHALLKRKYQVGIISSNFSPIVAALASQLGIKYYECVNLSEKGNKITGEITLDSKQKWLQGDTEDSFKQIFSRIIRRVGAKHTETVMVAGSERSIPLMKTVGISIAYKPTSAALKEVADKTISLHAEILAIIE
jgi:glycosyltransferase involved in cell wall biosynthesis